MERIQVKLDKVQETPNPIQPILGNRWIVIVQDKDDFGLGVLVGSMITICGFLIGLVIFVL